jgi:hypothetical protein
MRLDAITVLENCLSFNKAEISHYNFNARETGLKKRILVIGGIHGDEHDSTTLAFAWIERLSEIATPSNTWRIIPVLNPDGLKNKTRFNANNVDINRNFPTLDWDKEALFFGEKKLHRNPRRYPGPSAGSEPETKCLIKHIEDFQPDLVVAIHTPYGQFDFDGPIGKKIHSKILPWKRIGTFTGSLGRYLWDERKIPVLTIELGPKSLQTQRGEFIQLQDQFSDLI